MLQKIKRISYNLLLPLYTLFFAAKTFGENPTIQVNEKAIGFKIPSLGDLLTFAIRGFFIIAGLLALIYLLTGAMAWITSGGNKENVDKARDKITNAILGLIIIVGVLAIIFTLEQIVFGGRLCLGITCPLTIPSLLTCPGGVNPPPGQPCP